MPFKKIVRKKLRSNAVARSKRTTGGVIGKQRTLIPVNQIVTKPMLRRTLKGEIETKYHDIPFTAPTQPYLVSALATIIVPLSDVAQGQSDTTRIGDKISIRSLEARMEYLSADATNVIRCIIFQWYPNTNIVGSAPQGSQIINDTVVFPVLSNYVHDFQNQLGILYDSFYDLDNVANPSRVLYIKPNLKFCKKTINYTAASIEGSNKLFMLLVSDSAAVTHPSVKVHCRFFFDDA